MFFQVKDFKTYSDCLVYSVPPIKEIVHIYDIQFLLIKLQNLFKEGDVKFEEGAREYKACWNDISLVLNLSSEFKILSNYLSDNKDVSRRVHIFTQQIFEQLLELEAQGMQRNDFFCVFFRKFFISGILSEDAGGSAVLLNCIRSFLQFTELDLVDLNLMCKVDGWDSFTGILPTMTFQKSKKRTCTKMKPTVIRELANPSIRRKIDFLAEENSEDVERLAEDVDDLFMMDESEENGCEKLENCRKAVSNKKNGRRSDGRHGKQKKAKDANLVEMKTGDNGGSSKTRSHLKKLHDKQKFGKTASKKANISAGNEKTDTKHIVRGDVENDPVENKLYETEDLENVSRKKSNKNNNKAHLACDIDKNNNSEGNYVFQGENECDTKNKRNRLELNDENFDIVINDAQKFFESFLINYNNSSSIFAPSNTENTIPNNLRTAERPPDDFVLDKGIATGDEANYNDFCSQTDEETENCVTEICDKVPNIVEALCNEDLTDEFEPNDVTCEMLCTVFGTKKLMENLLQRRVKVAKPDAFVVEHVDFLVTIIKRDKNKINPVYYYGHNYGFLNTELAFSTLQNNTGLFLVKT